MHPKVAAPGTSGAVVLTVWFGEEGVAFLKAMGWEQSDLIATEQAVDLIFVPADGGGRCDDLRGDRSGHDVSVHRSSITGS